MRVCHCRDKPWFRWLRDGIVSVFRNVYDAGPLEELLHETFGEALLSRALTSVIIPAFDTDKQDPVFFSDLKVPFLLLTLSR